MSDLSQNANDSHVSELEKARLSLMVASGRLTIKSISKHASRRAAQRGIGIDEIESAVMIGERIHQDGAVIFFLGRRQLKRSGFAACDQERLEGLTVLMSRDGMVITAYRNRSGVAARLRRRGHHCRYIRNWR